MRSLLTILILGCLAATLGSGLLGALSQSRTPPSQADSDAFKGTVEAAATVKLHPHVGGYVTKILFKDGAQVKRGEVLFEIDLSPYKAQYDVALAQVALNEASLRYAVATNARFKELYGKSKGTAVSERELAQYQALEDQAKANLELARANLALAQINLDGTKVTSPIDGQIDRALVTPGNHVAAGTTLLAMIRSGGPRFVSFEVDQNKHLQLATLAKDAAKADGKGSLRVVIGLAGDQNDFPYQGVVDFVGTSVDQATGKVRWRAAVADMDPNVLPGFAVRVRVVAKK